MMKNGLFTTAAVVLIWCGCSPQGTGPSYETSSSSSSGTTTSDRPVYQTKRQEPVRQSRPLITGSQNMSGNQARQYAFLNRIREADPQYKTIDRAVMNDNNELGIVLDRNVNMDDIPALMRSLIKQMAAEFPGQDLTVLAYGPSNPPVLIGTGRLNAQTRDMTYTPAQPSNNQF